MKHILAVVVLFMSTVSLADFSTSTFLYRCNFRTAPGDLICTAQGTLCIPTQEPCFWDNTFAIRCTDQFELEDLLPKVTSTASETEIMASGDAGETVSLRIPGFDRSLGVFNAVVSLPQRDETMGICNIEPAR